MTVADGAHPSASGLNPRREIVVPFVFMDAIDSPNLRFNEASQVGESYRNCLITCFASFRRWNPGLDTVLFSNVRPASQFADQLESLGVKLKVADFLHRPPAGALDRFVSSFYLLDAISSQEAESVLYVDPDVVCVGPVDSIFEETQRMPGGITIDYRPDDPISGLSRRQAGELHATLGEPRHLPSHYGGEVLAVPECSLSALRARIASAWRWNEANWRDKRVFTTEEHVLSFALAGMDCTDLSGHARRIWTARTYRNVNGLESALALWHVPAEKGRGLDVLASAASSRESWFWTTGRDEFVDTAGRLLGFHNRSLVRWAQERVGAASSVWRRTRTSGG